MSQDNGRPERTQIELVISENGGASTEFAGVLELWRLWQKLGVNEWLDEAGIRYGDQENKAATLSFAAMVGPLVNAISDRRIAQRFDQEPSPDNVQTDALLSEFVEHAFCQRTLNRFMAHERHNWLAFHQARVQWLQQQPDLKAWADGVVIVDDFPIPKPYAEKMEGLTTIRDQNLERFVPGYQVVHLYYHHAWRPDYSLYLEKWKPTYQMGERPAKKSSSTYRPARPDEERNRLDIALDSLRQFLPLLPAYKAVLFDSWFTARWFGHELNQMDVPWIGVAEGTQKFELTESGDYWLVADIVERYSDECAPVETDESFLAVAIPAIIRPNNYTKVAQHVQLVLVREQDDAQSGPSPEDEAEEPECTLLICNQLHWSVDEIVSLFQCRPQIETAHRQGKQQEAWADFQHRRWECMVAYLAFALLRSLFLILLRLWREGLDVFSVETIITQAIQSMAVIKAISAHHLRLHLPRGQPAAHLCLQAVNSCDLFVCC
jgi:hypothetical protein